MNVTGRVRATINRPRRRDPYATNPRGTTLTVTGRNSAGGFVTEVPQYLPDGRQNPLWSPPTRPSTVPWQGATNVSWSSGSSYTGLPRLLPGGKVNPLWVAAQNGGRLPPGAPATPPARPPAQQPQQPNPLPYEADPVYLAGEAALARQRDDTLAGLRNQQAGLDLGYGGQNGILDALNADPSNPFSRLALLKQNFEQARQGARIGMAGRGQLYAGSFQNAMDENAQGRAQAYNTLAQQYAAATQGVIGRQGAARSAYDLGLVDLMRQATERAIANRPTSPAAGDQNDPGGGTAGPSPKDLIYRRIADMKAKGYLINNVKGSPRLGQFYRVVKTGGKTYHVYENGTRIRMG